MVSNRKAFTIIEVVLVLAIAGLIFLMVFIALPALQRSQRNTRRRQDMSRILGAFTEYQGSNARTPQTSEELAVLIERYITGIEDYAHDKRGASIATDSAKLIDCQGSEQFCDPDGTSYNFSGPAMRASTINYSEVLNFSHKIYYNYHAKCGENEGEVTPGDGNNNIALIYVLEGGAIFCGDNQ